MADIEVKGFTEVMKTLEGLQTILDEREMEDIMLAGARGMATKIRQEAPVGPTKNLKRAIKAKKFRKKYKGEPAAYVTPDHKIARHAHLVERGTVLPRKPKKSIGMRRPVGEGGADHLGAQVAGGFIWFGQEVEPMPADPFWTRGINGSADKVSNNITKKSLKLIEKRAVRGR